MKAIARVRKPDYTGENRCTACTVVNSVIAASLVVGVGWFGLVTAGPSAALLLSLLTGGIAASSIYLRGYLVPKTPELTKRYFPRWLLDWFGKNPVTFDEDVEDTEDVLIALDVVREVEDTTELTPEFADDWLAAVADTPEDDTVRSLLAGLSVSDEPTVTTSREGDGVEVAVEDGPTRTWESEMALEADVVSASVLQGGPWDGLGAVEQLQCLRRIRAYLDECPCGGRLEIEPGDTLVCCSNELRPILTCNECGGRIHEFGDPA